MERLLAWKAPIPWHPEGVPWFQEIEAGRARQAQLEKVPRLGFFEGIVERDPGELLQSFADSPQIDDPWRGRIEGEDSFVEYVASTKQWLETQGGESRVALTVTKERTAEELVIAHPGDGPDLPVAIISELAKDGRIESIRIYLGSAPE